MPATMAIDFDLYRTPFDIYSVVQRCDVAYRRRGEQCANTFEYFHALRATNPCMPGFDWKSHAYSPPDGTRLVR